MVELIAFEDPDHEGNSSEYHTGMVCITTGCTNPAGTKWSPFWCFECNVERIRRINKQFDQLMMDMETKES